MQTNWLEPKELLALLKAARKRSVRDWCLLLMAYRHALRAVEISRLKVSDVDLKSRTVRIRRVKGSLENVQPIDRIPGVSELDEPRALKLWLAEREREATRRGDHSDALFLSQKGGPLTPNAIWRIFQACAAAAGITGRSTHSLKHSRVTHLLRAGAPISEVRQAVGHKALTSTLRYVHATDESAARAVRQAEAALF